MNSQPIKKYVNVVNGFIHIQLPESFSAKRVELTIIPIENEVTQLSSFQQFLLDSPEMSDDELQKIQEKREHFNQWK